MSVWMSGDSKALRVIHQFHSLIMRAAFLRVVDRPLISSQIFELLLQGAALIC
jgi:hypothetical protein